MHELTYDDLFGGEINERKIREYEYKGSDDSILYGLLVSPVSEFMVKRVVPLSMAPNLITTIGFLLTVLPNLIVLLVVRKDSSPSWLIYFIQGSFMMIYSVGLFKYRYATTSMGSKRGRQELRAVSA